MSQDGVSDSVLCITTLSTMINLFQGNQSVLFSDMKGDLSKTRVTEIPPTATRSKLEKKKQIVLFLFFFITLPHLSMHHKNFMFIITALNLVCEIIQVYIPCIHKEALPLCAFSLYASTPRHRISLLLGLSPLYLSTSINTSEPSVTELSTQLLWFT